MKKLLIVSLVSLASTLSYFANAASSLSSTATAAYIPIQNVHADYSKMELTVGGELPNPCFSQLLAGLYLDDTQPNTLILRVSGMSGADMCVALVQPYSLVVNVPVAVRESGISINPAETYKIRTEGADFSMQVPGSALVF